MTDDMAANDEKIRRLLDKRTEGEFLDLQKAMAADNAARQAATAKARNEEVVLQLLVARMEKAIGKKVDQKILIAALTVIAVKAIGFSPKHKHGQLLVNMATAMGVLLGIELGMLPPAERHGDETDGTKKGGGGGPHNEEEAARVGAGPSEGNDAKAE
jgi:hypothetical protein